MALVLLLTLLNVKTVAMILFTLVLNATLINLAIPVFFRIRSFVRFMIKVFPPAIPESSLTPADGQRWFLVNCLTADPFAERIVGHYRKAVKFNLGGQLSLWEQESKKTV